MELLLPPSHDCMLIKKKEDLNFLSFFFEIKTIELKLMLIIEAFIFIMKNLNKKLCKKWKIIFKNEVCCVLFRSEFNYKKKFF